MRRRRLGQRGLGLVEVVIAGALFAMLVGFLTVALVTAKKSMKASSYQYVAIEIARQVMETGAANSSHQHAYHYMYGAAATNSLPAQYGCGSACTFQYTNNQTWTAPGQGVVCPGVPGCNGCADLNDPADGNMYAVKETLCNNAFNLTNTGEPFWALGDVLARGLVPKDNPNSVDIIFMQRPYTASDPLFSVFPAYQACDPTCQYYNAATNSCSQLCTRNVFTQEVTISWQEGNVKHFQHFESVPESQVNDILRLQTKSFTMQ